MPPIIEASGLTKHFGETEALDGLDLVGRVRPGHRAARPQRRRQDHVHQRGRHAAAARRRQAARRRASTRSPTRRQVRQVIGLAGQYASVEPAMTGRENLADGRPAVRPRPRPTSKRPPATCSSGSASTDAGDRLVRDYSGGMRRRLDLGASLVGRPRLLLLDEPTTGLDPRSRIELWEAIRDLVADGTDVLLTTQYLEEADQLARDVVIIDHGRVIAVGHARRAQGPGRPRRHRGPAPLAPPTSPPSPRSLGQRRRRGAPHRRRHPAGHRRRSTAAPTSSPPWCACSTSGGIAVDDIGLRRPTLDEVFLALTGQPIDAAGRRRRRRRRGLNGDHHDHHLTHHRRPPPPRPRPARADRRHAHGRRLRHHGAHHRAPHASCSSSAPRSSS